MSEYACQVFHNGLPEYLSEELEKIQRRTLRIIFPDLGYQEALKECNLATLHQRRQWLTERLFNEIKDNRLHKLHGLLPPRNLSTVALRRKHAFNVPFFKTKRLMNSFIMHNAAIFNGFIVYSRLNFKFYYVVFLFFCLNLLLFEYNRFLSFRIF